MLYVDSFGNVALNVTREHVAELGIVPGTQVELELAGERFYAVAARTFADARAGDIMLYEDSYRNMSVAITDGERGRDAARPRGAVDPDQRRPALTCVKAATSVNLRVIRAFAERYHRPGRPFYECGGLLSAQGRAASICETIRKRSASPSGGPTSWTPIGSPVSVQWSGSETAGWPVTLNAAVNGVNCTARSNCSHGILRLGLPADRHGWHGECRGQQQVVVRPERGDLPRPQLQAR